MQLWQLLEGLADAKLAGSPSTPIRGLAYDSRSVEPGYLFAALRGQKSDGNEFVDSAMEKGAVAVLSHREPGRPTGEVAWVQVDNERRGLALMARNYYGRPDEQMTLVGVTGTNGKTTVSFLLESILAEAGLKPCILGTVLYRYNRDETKAGRTTPESLDLYRLLDRYATAGARSCAMEVSSHSLVLDRVAGLRFAAAVFTNLTQDHLDFHGTMERYFEAKAALFRGLDPKAVAILNADDPHAGRLRGLTRGRVLTFGQREGADVRLEEIRASASGTEIALAVAPGLPGPGRLRVHAPLLGRPNAFNLAAAAATALALDVPPEAVEQGLLSVRGVPGRFERVDEGQRFTVLVDYAHTDDALRTLLLAVRDLRPRRVIAVFGCGGDRDRGKRPLMGFAAAAGSDVVVVTSDNPRSEDPMAIIQDILPGVRRALGGDAAGQERCLVIPDRKEAIRRALSLAGEGDCVVVAGKGHETYQILGDRTIPFDDREVAREALRSPAGGSARGQAAC
ncbi:MAG TPA: UDP-N-acetylmuramoyl-L-alanyl-D-glutamate--2,6-diaminopimelate ligase [Candidatus Polarisedimenticolia bacterium]|nr:UDP-N-acetylmuramoyl-L-alanyl-D-glutamate--2,6-diaminopimelate ligase [Candidatus Polarisedimenticolia bacterium]